MEAHLLLATINNRRNSPKDLVSIMMNNIQHDPVLMPAYNSIADQIGGKVTLVRDMINIIETAFGERYIKTKSGDAAKIAKSYVCTFLDDLVECLFPEQKTWPIAKEALHRKFSCVSEVPKPELVEA
ncbi:MAG: hypothetical protein WEC83_00325 [Patescibacteria group bacterium]